MNNRLIALNEREPLAPRQFVMDFPIQARHGDDFRVLESQINKHTHLGMTNIALQKVWCPILARTDVDLHTFDPFDVFVSRVANVENRSYLHCNSCSKSYTAHLLDPDSRDSKLHMSWESSCCCKFQMGGNYNDFEIDIFDNNNQKQGKIINPSFCMCIYDCFRCNGTRLGEIKDRNDNVIYKLRRPIIPCPCFFDHVYDANTNEELIEIKPGKFDCVLLYYFLIGFRRKVPDYEINLDLVAKEDRELMIMGISHFDYFASLLDIKRRTNYHKRAPWNSYF